MKGYNQKRIPLLGQENNALTWLIIINATVFILLNFLNIVYFFTDMQGLFADQVLKWFTLPASLDKLATRPWTIFSYMFTHMGPWQLISSLLWLWGFGYILQDLAGNQKLIPIYLYGGFIGALFFLLVNNIFPVLIRNTSFTPDMIGAGSSLMAIAVATTTLAPDYRIFPLINGGIPLWVLALLFVAIDFALIASAGAGVAVAHLSGAALGFVYVRQLRNGNDWGAWMISFHQWLDDLFNPEKKNVLKKEKDRLFYKSNSKPYQKTPNITQQKLDDILDKINQQGYHLLTDEEKEFLKRASKEEL